MEKLNQIEQQIESLVANHQKLVKRIEKSDDPVFHDKAKRDYEIRLLEKELDEEVDELSRQYLQVLDELIEEEKRGQALKVNTVSTTGKSAVDQRLSEYIAEVVLAQGKQAKQAAFSQFLEHTQYFDANQVHYLQTLIPDAIAKLNGDKDALSDLRLLNQTIKEVLPQSSRIAELENKRTSAGKISYNQYKIAKQTNSKFMKGLI